MLQLKLICLILLFSAVLASDHPGYHHEHYHPRARQTKYVQEDKVVEVPSEFLHQPESINFIPLNENSDKPVEVETNEDVDNTDAKDLFGYNLQEEKDSKLEEESEENPENSIETSKTDDDIFVESFFPTLLFLLSQPIFDEMIPETKPTIEEKEEPLFYLMNSDQNQLDSESSCEPKLELDIKVEVKLPNLETSPAIKPINRLKRIIRRQKHKIQQQKLKKERKRLTKLLKKIENQLKKQNRKKQMTPIWNTPKNFRGPNQRQNRFNKNQQETFFITEPMIFDVPRQQNNFNEPSIFDFIPFPIQQQQQQQNKPSRKESSSFYDYLFLPQPPQKQQPKQNDIIFFDLGPAPQKQQKESSLLDILLMPPQQKPPKQDDIIFIDLDSFQSKPKENPKQSSPFDFLFFPSETQSEKSKQDDIIFLDLGSSNSGRKDQTSSIFDILFFPSPVQSTNQNHLKDNAPVYESKPDPTFFDFLRQSQEVEVEPEPKKENHKFPFFDFIF